MMSPTRKTSRRTYLGMGVAVVLAVSCLFGPTVAGSNGAAPAIAAYTIAGTKYYSGSVIALAQYLPRLPSAVSLTLKLLSRCPALQVRAYISVAKRDGGIVAYSPTSILNCEEVTGGGPVAGGGPSASQPCARFFTTQNYYAFVAGSDFRTCVDLSTEVPGSADVTSHYSLTPAGASFAWPAGTQFVVKAQHYDAYGRLLDYIATPAASVPANRNPFWVFDVDVTPNGKLGSVPLF